MAGRGQVDDTPKKKLTRNSLRELGVLLRYMRPYRLQFFLGLAMLLFSTLTTLVFPGAIGKLVDAVQADVGAGDSEVINTVGLVLVIALVVQAIFSYFRIVLFVTVTEKALSQLRKDVYERLVRLPMAFFGERRVGELTSRLTADISLIQETFTTTIAELLRAAVNLLGGTAVLFFLSPELTLVMLASFPVLVVVAIFFGRFIRKISKAAQDKLADATVVVEETLQGIQAVKSYTNERFETMRYHTRISEAVGITLRGAKWRGAFSGFIIVAIFGAIIGIFWYGASLVAREQLTIGDLTAFLIYTLLVGSAVGGGSEFYSQLQKTLGATERVRELLRTDPEASLATDSSAGFPSPPGEGLGVGLDTAVGPDTVSIGNRPALKGSIRFENVHFAYPSRADIPVLKGLDFSIEPGQQVALVGTSGAGKSTVISLLQRFYAPTSGTIYLDNQPASELPLNFLRQQMALVPQDVLLFGGTIQENIAYGDLSASDTAIVEAAEKANAHSFITSFPEGYNTVVGERGVKLSGGQRQRIAIARAMLRNPAILLLDEATSSLDSESERVVQEALETLMQGRTALVIAHRLATVRNADNILVLQDGVVAEQGTHQALIHQPDGVYRMLARLQFADEELV